MMINSTTRLGKNTRKTYKWSGIGLLDQLRYNKKKMLSYRAGVDLFWKGDHMQISYFLIPIKAGLDPVILWRYHPTLKLSGISSFTLILSLTYSMDNV